jgi:hypothetical protein
MGAVSLAGIKNNKQQGRLHGGFVLCVQHLQTQPVTQPVGYEVLKLLGSPGAVDEVDADPKGLAVSQVGDIVIYMGLCSPAIAASFVS